MTADQLLAVLNVAALVAIMFSMGLQVKFESLLTAMRPVRIVIACVVVNFLVVPLIAIALLFVFQSSPMVWIGFLVLAVSPAAPVGPPLTSLAEGNLSLAVALMIVLAVLSPILSPTLLALAIPKIALDGNIQIESTAIIKLLLTAQIIPLAAGLLVHYLMPRFANWLSKPMKVLANLLLFALIIAIIVKEWQTLASINVRAWLGMTLLLGLSLVAGWFCGGSELSNRKAVAITTGPRNAAVGLAIAGNSFANTPAVAAVVAYGLVSMLATMAIAGLLGRRTTTVS